MSAGTVLTVLMVVRASQYMPHAKHDTKYPMSSKLFNEAPMIWVPSHPIL